MTFLIKLLLLFVFVSIVPYALITSSWKMRNCGIAALAIVFLSEILGAFDESRGREILLGAVWIVLVAEFAGGGTAVLYKKAFEFRLAVLLCLLGFSNINGIVMFELPLDEL